MEVKFLGQGYERISVNSVGNHLIELLSDQEFQSFTAISAFTSEAGMVGLSPYINSAKQHLKSITIITGIDQKVTSKEALNVLMELDVGAYVFHQSSGTIFHPKIYLFEGVQKSVLIIGSSNLTAQGLFNNVETSLLLKIDKEEKEEVITQLKNYYQGLFDLSDPNLKPLTQKLIKKLVKLDIVPTEKDRRTSQRKDKKTASKETAKLIQQIFPKREITRIPSGFKKQKKGVNKKIKNQRKSTQNQINYTKILPLWESGPLTQRDLNIPAGIITNPTGSMLFKKGKMEDIDQRHFFRDEVFSSLNWQNDPRKNLSHLERAKAIFKIIVEGKESGEFKLKLTHNSRTNTKTYQQNNSMTSISWGEAKTVIAKQKLIGKTVKLFKRSKEIDQFVLVFE